MNLLTPFEVTCLIAVYGITLVSLVWLLTRTEKRGIPTIVAGLGGVDGTHRSLFDPWIAFTMGIPMTLGLISGPIGDQVFFQRAMAAKKENIAKTFVLGGLCLE